MSDVTPLPVSPAPHLPQVTKASSAQETAKNFEAVFLGTMTQLMLESVETGSEFSGGHGEQMFRGVLAEKLGTAITQRGGIGLAPSVLDAIIKLQQGNAQ